MTFWRNSIKTTIITTITTTQTTKKELTIKHNCNVCIIYASSFPTKNKEKYQKLPSLKPQRQYFLFPLFHIKSVPCHAIYLFFCQWTSATAGTQFHSGGNKNTNSETKLWKIMCTNLDWFFYHTFNITWCQITLHL